MTTNDETRPQEEQHLTYRKDIIFEAACAKKMEFWSGPWEELLKTVKDKANQMYHKTADADLPSGNTDTGGGGWGYPFISNISLQRRQGNIGHLTVTISQPKQIAFASIDFIEVSRPIICWHAWKEGEEGEESKPDLSLIMQWQQNKDNNPTTYAEFKTGDGTELTGETKKLAEMMYKGIDHYPVYIPVVSITLKTGDPPQLGLYPIGSLHAEPEVPFGWDLAGESDMDEIISGVKDSETGEKFAYWIITSSRSAANSDGTFSWTIQYQGATSIETELFS